VRVKVLPQNWAVGQRAEVFVETGRQESTLALPVGFLSWRTGKPGVLIKDRGRARWRGVKLGLRGVESVQVVEGLSAEEIVYKPREMKQPLKDGQRVSAR
jgi:HlyD family secretion protein